MELKIENTASAKKTSQTQPADTEDLKKEARARGEYIVSVSGNEKGLFAIAKKFKMSLTDFKNMTGLTKDTLQKGQVIKNVPTAKIESGMGLAALARKNGMTLKEFTELNGIKENYKPQKGEYFYVYPQKKNTTKSPKSVPAHQRKTAPTVNHKTENKSAVQKPGADEIAEKLEKAADDYIGAVGREEFDRIFK